MINEIEIKNKGNKATFTDLVSVAIQRLLKPSTPKKDKENAVTGLLMMAKALDKNTNLIATIDFKIKKDGGLN